VSLAAGHVVDRVRGLLADSVHIDVPSPDTDLIEGGLLDSLALVELIFQLEQEFEVSVPLDDLEIDRFRTVTNIGELIVALTGSPDGVGT
jgi:methoxymalonate biosynthesis acyl carrier protein